MKRHSRGARLLRASTSCESSNYLTVMARSIPNENYSGITFFILSLMFIKSFSVPYPRARWRVFVFLPFRLSLTV